MVLGELLSLSRAEANSDQQRSRKTAIFNKHCSTVKVPLLGSRVPEVGSRASLGRAWWLWAAQYSQGEARPVGPQPLPQVLELAASKGRSPISLPLTI